jgi:hypothetical protein
MARSPRIPKYRRHTSGQARVTLNGKDQLLGPYGSPASREAYDRLIAEWLENQRRPPRPAEDARPLSVAELILAYWKHAEDYYGFKVKDRGDEDCLRKALGVVRRLYGSTPARDFGSKALKACRQHMVGLGWSRTYINAQVDRARRMFRWGAEEELFPEAAEVYHRLAAVRGLRRGKTQARETEKVKPVPQEHVDATLPHLPAVVGAMVRFQLLTGVPSRRGQPRPPGGHRPGDEPGLLDLPAPAAQDRAPRPRPCHPDRPPGPTDPGPFPRRTRRLLLFAGRIGGEPQRRPPPQAQDAAVAVAPEGAGAQAGAAAAAAPAAQPLRRRVLPPGDQARL